LRRPLQWLLRCLLIAVLTLDLIGSPFHGHHHDSGTFQMDTGAAAGHSDDDGHDVHAESGDPRVFMHSVAALRAGTATVAAPAGLDESDDAAMPVAALAVSRSTAAAALTWRPARKRVGLSVFRSLPPDGRAPPVLHS
jgi:hypothetical protein